MGFSHVCAGRGAGEDHDCPRDGRGDRYARSGGDRVGPRDDHHRDRGRAARSRSHRSWERARAGRRIVAHSGKRRWRPGGVGSRVLRPAGGRRVSLGRGWRPLGRSLQSIAGNAGRDEHRSYRGSARRGARDVRRHVVRGRDPHPSPCRGRGRDPGERVRRQIQHRRSRGLRTPARPQRLPAIAGRHCRPPGLSRR